MTRRLSAAEAVLRDLGIGEPEEIDVEAIAWHLGAKSPFDNYGWAMRRNINPLMATSIMVSDTSTRAS